MSARLTLSACVVAAAVVLTQLPGPAEVLDLLSGAVALPTSAGTPLATVQSVLLITAGLVAWLLAAWAVVVVGVGLFARLPGRSGHRARRLLPRIAPASVGRLVLAAVGVSLIAGTAACAAPTPPGATVGAATSSPTPTPTPSSPSSPSGSFTIDWPAPSPSPAPNSPGSSSSATPASTTASSVPSPDSTAPTSTATPSTAAPSNPISSPGGTANGPAAPSDPPASSTVGSARPAPGSPAAPGSAPISSSSGQPSTDVRSASPSDSAATPTGSGETVTVHAGDSLWRIAEDALGPAATASEVDNAWRAWYFVNREVIGDDPDVILPGQSLLAPSVEQVRP